MLRAFAVKDLWVGRILKITWHNRPSKSFSNVSLNAFLCVWLRESNLSISWGSLFHFKTVLIVKSPKGEIFILSAADTRTFSQENTLIASLETNLSLLRSESRLVPL